MLRELLQELPLIAILRGIRPEEMPAAADALMAAGFRILEVPLNSPRPLESIRYLAGREGLLSGAGTVLTSAEVEAVAAAGGRLVVAPNADAEVIAAAKRLGLTALPGVATPTEAFAALKAGADGLKMFPAELHAAQGDQGLARRAAGRRRCCCRWAGSPRDHGRLPRRRRRRLRPGLGPLQAGHGRVRAGRACPRLRGRLPGAASAVARR